MKNRLASLDINFRQHEHYNREACLDHLSFCFRHNMGAPAFVNRYVNKRPAIAYPGLILADGPDPFQGRADRTEFDDIIQVIWWGIRFGQFHQIILFCLQSDMELLSSSFRNRFENKQQTTQFYALIKFCKTPSESNEVHYAAHELPPWLVLWRKFRKTIKWDASYRWSFGQNFAWGSIRTMTIRKTHPTLFYVDRFGSSHLVNPLN